MNSNGQSRAESLTVQAALVIRGFAILGFDYFQTRKQVKPANNEGKTQF